jgi:hypothetical protein
LRAAAFRTLRRGPLAEQTLEPTEVAGFNQLYDDFIATETSVLGMGVDLMLSETSGIGVYAMRRWLDTPAFFGAEENPFYQQNWREKVLGGYAYTALSPRLSLAFEPVYDLYERENTDLLPDDLPLELRTLRVPTTLRFSAPSGVFAYGRINWVHQQLDRQQNVDSAEGTDSFFLLDAGLGYRLPDQRGEVSLDVLNLLDENFSYQDDNFRTRETHTPPFRPDRLLLFRVSFRL